MPHPTFDNLPADKRERLVNALKAEFAQHSFTSASVDRITQNAGVSKGSFYQYFLDKADAYLFAVQDSLERRVAMTDDLGADATFSERLASILQDTQTFQIADPLSWGVLARANSGDAPAISSSVQLQGGHMHEWVREAVCDGIDSGELRPDLDPDAAAWLVEHTVIGLGEYLLTRFEITSAQDLGQADPETQASVYEAAAAVIAMLHRALGIGVER